MCPCFNLYVESVEHLTLLCDWAKSTWYSSPLSFRFDEKNVTRIEVWWCEFFTGKQLGEYELALVATICWYIWKGRCAVVFENSKLDPLATMSKAGALVSDFWKANGWTFSFSNQVDDAPLGNNQWLPPCDNCFKANSDGAFIEGKKQAGIGVIIRDYTGSLIESLCCTSPAHSAFMVEALALRKLTWIFIKLILNLIVNCW